MAKAPSPIPAAEIQSGYNALKATGGWPLAIFLTVLFAGYMLRGVIDAWEEQLRADTDAAQRILRLVESGQYVPKP